jgi:starch synthase
VRPIALHVAAEVSPFHKSGGLGDVLSGLPPALSRAGYDTRIVTGFFGHATNLASLGGERALREWPVRLDVSVGGQQVEARVLEARTHNRSVTTYFVDAPHLSRGGLYGFGDDHFRFAILGKAAVAIASVLSRARSLGPMAILHAHDWHAALAVFYARLSPALRDVATIFTIHNLAFQGEAEASTTPYLDIPWDAYHDLFENHGTLNLMKGAILLADRVTTVSANYAREIQTRQYGQGLDGLLRHVSDKLRGMPNGIDTRSWNPAADRALPATFTADAAESKLACTEALRWELGLENREDLPILGVVSRLTRQKGIDWLCDVAARFVHEGGQLAVLGEGEEDLEHRLHWLEAGHRGAIAYRRAFDDGLARRIYAGSDLFAMPSRFEPCGLAQMYAMRYGSIPIARATGGLVDTIAPLYDRHAVGGATGIVYDGHDAGAFESALRWGREVYHDSFAHGHIRSNAMRMNHSWEEAAKNYVHMYSDLGVEPEPSRPRSTSTDD